ncbi:hypothetical protein D9M68_916510 [compost metagenome]
MSPQCPTAWFEAREGLAPHHEVSENFALKSSPHGEVRHFGASNHEGVAEHPPRKLNYV